MNNMERERKLKKREIKKQKDEMTEEKKLKECLYCSSVFTLDSSFSSFLVVFHVCFCSCFNFHVCFSSSLTFMSSLSFF
jgi:5-methylcytosine-specific restriction endonuclease McrA